MDEVNSGLTAELSAAGAAEVGVDLPPGLILDASPDDVMFDTRLPCLPALRRQRAEGHQAGVEPV